MATWIKQPWIENALKSSANSLPKIARAQVLKLEDTVAVISDKKFFVKAEFSPTAIEQFKRDNTSLQLSDIQGGLIFVKKYSVCATAENELDHAEFVININEFKFAGGEGNTQFGSDVTNSSSHPPLKSRLWQLWRAGQLRKQLVGGEANISDAKETERLLLHNHNQIFVPDGMERRLAEIPEWKPNYFPPQTYDIQSDISLLEGQVQEQSCPSSTDFAGHATAEKEYEKCDSQECLCDDKPFVSSSYVPSSQRESRLAVEQPLKGLFPEELFSPSSDTCTSQMRGSSEESYSILQRRSCIAENEPDVSVVPSSQNSPELNEQELDQALPHVTPERKAFHCSLSESQLERFLDASVSLDEVTAPPFFTDVSPSIEEGFTQVKLRESTSSDKSKLSFASSHSRAFAGNERSLASSRGSEKNTRSDKKDSDTLYNVVTEVEVVSPSRDNVRNAALHRKESLEKAKVDFDALFRQNTWKLSQTPSQEFSADVFEIDKRQSIKRKRSEKDDSKHKRPSLSDEGIQARKLSFPDSPVSPDSTPGSMIFNQSVSSQSQPSNQSSSRPEDLYTQQDPLMLDTSGSTESLKSPRDHEENSPSILEISMDEPCTLSTPNFDSLPSYQVPGGNRAKQSDDTSSPISRDQRDELFASTTPKWDVGPPQEPDTSRDFAENVIKPTDLKKKRKGRRNFNWFSDAY